MNRLSWLLPSTLLLACGGAPSAAAPNAPMPTGATEATVGAEAPPIAIPNAAQPTPGLLTGGQPTPEHLRAAREHGYRTVISLQTADEAGAVDERATAEGLGLRFVSIPIAGADDLTLDNAQKLADALATKDARPAIVHCASGNRAGALLAIKAFHIDGASAAEAVALGKRAGLTRLEPAVRERLVDSAQAPAP